MSAPPSPVSAALLAGGKSTRMGRDKCQLELDGVPLWRHQLDRLAPLTGELLVVAPTPPPWCPPSARWIEDLAKDHGPLGGLASALARATHEQVIVLAIDLPALTSDYLETLLAESSATCGVVPVIGDLSQPLSAVYPRAAAPAARAHLSLADKSLQCLLRDLIAAKMMRPIPISASDLPLFRNLNSAAD